MTKPFVHLHVHTEYSLVDGIVRLKPLVAAVAAADMPAIAVTEHGNMFSMVKFYRAAVAAGVKPIIGCDIALENEFDATQPVRVVLLCQSLEGFRNLSRLVSRSFLQGQGKSPPLLRKDWLEGQCDGLIALSGGHAGDIGQALLSGRRPDASRLLAWWQARFPNRFYLEVQLLGRDHDESLLYETADLAAEHRAPIVASNDVRFLRPEDFEAHEARVCINQGRLLDDPRRQRDYSAQQSLRSPAEMAELFAEFPEALANSVEIAQRCNVEFRFDDSALPDFPVPGGGAVGDWFEKQSKSGLAQRLSGIELGTPDNPGTLADYEQRLEMELGVITSMGFSGYFLIVADFIQWARDNQIPVGPGRGSGAGSLVAYSLGITDLNPLRFDLLFERFLNPERVSLPDFDIDFCMEGRDRVIDYVAERYGRDSEGNSRVSQIITFGTMAAKGVVRDVGRVLGYPYGFVDQLAKLIPFELGITLERALEEEGLKARYGAEDDVRTLFDLAQKLEGLARNAGRHAGGVVISPTTLTDFTPLYCERGSSSLVTQLDKDDVEAMGLVKFDFLGLRTLTIIDWALRSINRLRDASGEQQVDITKVPTDDSATFALIKSGATTAVFQLESRGMKDLIRRLQPDCFEDVIALVALFRPGPLQSGMVDDFIDRKHGRAAILYPHPDLEVILKPTYGVILYQEQVMQIAQVLARYSLGEADLLRQAMGKKKPEEMAKQRAVFVGGATSNGVDEDRATSIFDLMEKFAGYGFNKSHSAAYALIAYQTAWLKAHYPAAFMAAVLSADMDTTDKVLVFVDEAKVMGLTIELPNMNECEWRFSATSRDVIRYGLGAIKGVGEGAIEGIIQERDANGRFEDLFDFCRRVDGRRVNRRVLEALVRSGALDELGPTRATMMATLTYALQAADQHARNREAGQNDMFGADDLTVHHDYKFHRRRRMVGRSTVTRGA